MFGVLPAFAITGVATGPWGRGGSIARTELEKRSVLSSSSIDRSKTRGRSLVFWAATRLLDEGEPCTTS